MAETALAPSIDRLVELFRIEIQFHEVGAPSDSESPQVVHLE